MTEQVCDPEQEPAQEKDGAGSQFALPFHHRARFEAGGFVAAPSNARARAWLFTSHAVTTWSDGRLVLWGGAGRGKTHLLHVWAQRQGALVLQGVEPLPDVVALAEARPAAIALDAIPEHGLDEPGLLAVINLSREWNIPLLMASRHPPSRWRVSLADLQSRLRATMTVEMRAAEDILLHRLMLRLLAERQLTVARPVLDWLLRRLPREATAIAQAVARIDAHTLASGGAFDRAAAARLLEDMTSTSFRGREDNEI